MHLYAYYQGGEDGPLSSSCHYVLGTLELNLRYDREDQSIGLLSMQSKYILLKKKIRTIMFSFRAKQ